MTNLSKLFYNGGGVYYRFGITQNFNRNMKTAMQEFLEWMELGTHTHQEYFDKAAELLEKEKEQIVKAYNNGCIPEPYLKFWHGVHYYGEMYNETDTLIAKLE